MDIDAKVTKLLAAIEAEKRQPKPDKKKMRKWFNEVVKLKEDWRTTYTGQDNKYQFYTSMRTWSDDA